MNFFISNFGIFIPNFPLALPSSADWLSGWQGFVSEPLESWSVEQNMGTRVGVGERPPHTGTPAKPNHISSAHWPLYLGTDYAPEEYPKLFHCVLINLGLSASGKVTLVIKMPLWVSLKNKNKNSCSTTVIYSQRKNKTLVYTVQSPKILEALIHTYTHQTSLSLISHLLCASIPAPYPPPRKKASLTERKFCCQEGFKTGILQKKQSVSTFQKPVHWYTPRGNGVIVYPFLIPPLWTWHGDMMPCVISLQTWTRRHKYCMGEENPPGPHSHWLYLTQCAYRGELLEENAQELMTTGVTTTIWHFRLESI